MRLEVSPSLGLVDGSDDDARDIIRSLHEPVCFGRVFERHVGDIYRFHSARLGTSAAEDCTAETFMLAFRGRAAFNPALGKCRAWLFGIATNVARREARTRARRAGAIERLQGRRETATDVTDESSEQVLAGDLVRTALAGLDEDLRDVMLLVGGAGLTYEETANALTVPIGTVRSRMSRARRKLRIALERLSDGS